MQQIFATLVSFVAVAKTARRAGEGRHRRRVRPAGRPDRRRDHRDRRPASATKLNTLFTSINDALPGGAAPAAPAALIRPRSTRGCSAQRSPVRGAAAPSLHSGRR